MLPSASSIDGHEQTHDHSQNRIAPHPMMSDLYADDAQKQQFLRTIFDDTAADYDRIERLLALGSGSWYRRQALMRAGVGAGTHLIDVATGTGLVARQALTLVGPTGSVVGIDPSHGMLSHAKNHLPCPMHIGRAEAIPLPDASADFLTMGYALRHLDDLRTAFLEFRRVLRPGGRVCILEITRPRSRFGRLMLLSYMKSLAAFAGVFGRVSPRTPELWKYYWETIDRCVPPATVVTALESSGFHDAKHRRTLGIFSEYTATKPASADRP